jgi:integrase
MRKAERKSMSGLFKRNGVWRIDKVIDGERIQESCKTGDLAEAERYFIYKMEERRQAKIYGVRPKRIFRKAAIKFLEENQQKRSLDKDAQTLSFLDPFIGDMYLDCVNQSSLKPFIDARREEGVKNRTINTGLQLVRHILKLAASEWIDENRLTWLLSAPKIKLLDLSDQRPPRPISWEEQDQLFAALPTHLRQMALFAVNTGCRDQEICQLRWEWEVEVPQLKTSVFLIPGQWVKNTDDRLVILNDVARNVVEERRGIDGTYVFTYKYGPLYQMSNTGWDKAREETGLLDVRIHDLKHTFGARLRAEGVSYEDRQDLLGHRSTRITTHYSSADIGKLLTAANKVCCRTENTPLLTLIRRKNASEGDCRLIA